MTPVSDKSPQTARWLLAIVVTLVILGAAFYALQSYGGGALQKAQQSYDVRIVPLRTDKGVEILYRAMTPVQEISIPFPEEMIDYLTVTESSDIVSVVPVDGGVKLQGTADIALTGILVSPEIPTPVSNYPAVQFGTEALVLNMPLFTPFEINGTAVDPAVADTSQFFWLAGGGVNNADNSILMDTALPPNLGYLLLTALPDILTYYETAFEQPLSQAPQLMLLYEEGREGQLTIEADAVPGQLLIKFTGQSFGKDLPEARRMVLLNLAHEIVHLWQLEQPGVGASPDWLHEGAANALSAEALFVSGQWSDVDYGEALEAAKDACAETLRNGTIVNAGTNGHHQTSYACGHMILAATAGQRQGATIAQLWKAYTADISARGADMTADSFYRFASGWAENDKYGLVVQKFVTMNFAYGDRDGVIDQLFAGTL
jgi:hypothetical protein